MKSSERRPPDPEPAPHPVLFDLPLGPSPGGEEEPPAPRRPRTPRPEGEGAERKLPLFDANPAKTAPAPVARPRAVPAPAIALDPEADDEPAARPPVGRRWLSGIADVAIAAAWTGFVGFAALRLVPAPAITAWIPLLAAGALFSLLYTVLTLRLWRRTPGMMFVGLVCASDDHHGISLGQGARRWVAGVITVLGLGLPAALLWTGRSLADRLSESRVLALPA